MDAGSFGFGGSSLASSSWMEETASQAMEIKITPPAADTFMSKPNPADGGRAFPREPNSESMTEGSPGMTLRDYFAAAALQGMAVLAVYKREARSVEEAMDVHEHLAESAYAMADAMLKERSKP